MDKARLVSDADFQLIWGNILAEECNKPNSIPKGLLHILEQMDREDAFSFSRVRSVSVSYTDNTGDSYTPVILFNSERSFYESIGITFEALFNLKSLGLIEFVPSTDEVYFVGSLVKPVNIRYHDEIYTLPDGKNEFRTGSVIFTRVGVALRKAISVEKIDGFFQKYCLPFWERTANK